MTKNITPWELKGPFTYRDRGDDMTGYLIQGEIGGNTERTIAELGCWKDREHILEDGQLIVACQNACIAVNPKSPMAVALNIQKAIEALKLLLPYAENNPCLSPFDLADVKAVLSAIEKEG